MRRQVKATDHTEGVRFWTTWASRESNDGVPGTSVHGVIRYRALTFVVHLTLRTVNDGWDMGRELRGMCAVLWYTYARTHMHRRTIVPAPNARSLITEVNASFHSKTKFLQQKIPPGQKTHRSTYFLVTHLYDDMSTMHSTLTQLSAM